MDIIKSQKGFSLVEVVVGMLIMILVMGGICGIVSTSASSYVSARDEGINIQNARDAMKVMSKELQNAVAAPTRSADKKTINYVIRTSDTSKGTYETTDHSRSISIGAGADANTILLKEGGTTLQKLAIKGVTDLKFPDTTDAKGVTDKRKVAIELKVKSPENSHAPERTLTQEVVCLNEF